MITNIIKILTLFILILFVGFFTSSETAYLSLQKIKLRAMLNEKRKNAKIVAKLKANMDYLLTTVLIGTNFLNSLASALATAFAIQLLGSKGSLIAPFVAAFFITTFGQIIPKTTASLYPEKITCFSSVPLYLLEKIFFPVVWFFSKLSNLVVKLVEKLIKTPESLVTQEELKALIKVGESEGTLEKSESKMLNKLIRFNDLSVNNLMKSRHFVSMVSAEASYNQVTEEFIKSGFSTIAVYENSKDNVTGVLNYKSILFGQNKVENPEKPGFAKETQKEVIFVPGTLSVVEVLNKFKTDSHKFAVVLNEQGQTTGIITIEDIMKYVFGKMTEESGYHEVPVEDKIQLISFNTFGVPGEVKIEELNEVLNLNLESENYNTLAGWLLEKIGHLPSVGEMYTYKKVLFVVEDVVQHRIVSVRIKK